MTLLKPTRSLTAVVIFAFACAPAVAQERAEPPPIRIYEAAELTLASYTVVKRIWTGTWWASFAVPNHTDVASAIEALKKRAADAGADGVTNLFCLSDAPWDDRYFCYGLAIKLKEPPALTPPQPAAAGG